MAFKILDVGCGCKRGHHPVIADDAIRVDIEKTEWNRSYLNVQCSAEHLPFKPETFETVYLSHVLEHVEDPIKILKEALRVAKTCVIIKVPHRFSKSAKIKEHKRVFTRSWFLNFPSELEVVIWK